MMYYFGLYAEFIKIRLKAMVEYRGETLMTAVSQAAGYLAQFIILWIMIRQFGTLGKWNPYEIMLLYAFDLMTYAVAGAFFYGPCYYIPEMVRTGSFDEILTRPTNPLLYLMSSEFLYGYISHFLVAAGLMVFCFVKLSVRLTAFKVLFLFLTVIGGSLIQSALFLITAVPCFWLVESDAISSLLWDVKDFIRYPLSVYHKSIQIIMTFVIPFAFINFYPAQYFLGKSDFLMFHPVFQFLTPVVGVLLFILAYLFWHLGIRHYNSSGS